MLQTVLCCGVHKDENLLMVVAISKAYAVIGILLETVVVKKNTEQRTKLVFSIWLLFFYFCGQIMLISDFF